jgi:hypothetical protein
MSPEDAEQLARLLYRYAETELDQFDNWRLDTEFGPVYVSMNMELLPGWSDRAFDPVPKPGTRWQTGRSANVDGAEHAASREDVQRVIAQMRADLTRRGWPEWENPTLDRFLEALEAVLEGFLASSPARARLSPRSPTGPSLHALWSPQPDTSKHSPPVHSTT